MTDQVMWQPSEQRIENSQLTRFMEALNKKYDPNFEQYTQLHQWSVENPEQFWSELAHFYDVKWDGREDPICEDMGFTSYGWFPRKKLNFAENLLFKGQGDDVALNFVHESGLKREYTYKDVRDVVSKAQQSLKPYIDKGDVLACYMPNIAQTVLSMLATTSLGGVFTSTSCDFGIEGVLDRFGQSRPKVLVAAAAYQYNGKTFSLIDKIAEITQKVDSIEKVIVVDFLDQGIEGLEKIDKAISWDEFLGSSTVAPLVFEQVHFQDPLYIMYSSGTTGKPKCIVHSVGGTLLQHVKELGLHSDLTNKKNIFYFTTCGWMMWNWLVSSLFFGAKVTLYEGSPGYPSLNEFFEIIDREQINIFGTSPKFLKALEDYGWNKNSPLPSLETMLSTGAPLLPEQFDFVYTKVKEDLQLSSICGGTDIIGCFMLGSPISPVYRGEIQVLGLGMDVACFDEQGNAIYDQEGELVCCKSFPSRPIYFLNDENSEKINKAYFNKFPGVWHHGDFITITSRKSVQVFGRSDATLNPGGVRIGTAEIYRQTESLNYLEDSICVGKQVDGDVDVLLFVKMKSNEELTEDRILEIKKLIRTNTTPRHVPRDVFQVSDIPYTRSGKKMELAVTRILNGKKLTNIEAVANPLALEDYQKYL